MTFEPQTACNAPQTPKLHQLLGATFLRENKRCILADDMGTGTTLCSIQAAEGRTIVICPATVKANWRREILRERPDARVLILSGTVPSTIEPDVDFVILNYDIADAWQDYLIAWRPDTCICDEAHNMPQSQDSTFSSNEANRLGLQPALSFDRHPDRKQATRSCRAHKFPRKIDVFGGWKAFVTRYCDAHQTEWCFDTSGASNLNELHEKLHAEKIMLRRMKHEVLSLPQKTRNIARITIDPADLIGYEKCERELAAACDRADHGIS